VEQPSWRACASFVRALRFPTLARSVGSLGLFTGVQTGERTVERTCIQSGFNSTSFHVSARGKQQEGFRVRCYLQERNTLVLCASTKGENHAEGYFVQYCGWMVLSSISISVIRPLMRLPTPPAPAYRSHLDGPSGNHTSVYPYSCEIFFILLADVFGILDHRKQQCFNYQASVLGIASSGRGLADPHLNVHISLHWSVQ
jgi:hypothetical protein